MPILKKPVAKNDKETASKPAPSTGASKGRRKLRAISAVAQVSTRKSHRSGGGDSSGSSISGDYDDDSVFGQEKNDLSIDEEVDEKVAAEKSAAAATAEIEKHKNLGLTLKEIRK